MMRAKSTHGFLHNMPPRRLGNVEFETHDSRSFEIVGASVPTEGNGLDVALDASDFPQQIPTIDVGQSNIGNQHVQGPASGSGDSFVPRFGTAHIVTFPAQQSGQGGGGGIVMFYYKDAKLRIRHRT